MGPLRTFGRLPPRSEHMRSKGKYSLWAVGALAALFAAGTPAFAQTHGGGHGGGHASMGGHFSAGGARMSAPHFAPHAGSFAPHGSFAPRSGFAPHGSF